MRAGTVVWTGGQGGPATTWSSKNNWSGNRNAEPVAGDHLVFSGTNKLTNTNDLTAGLSFAGIRFDTNAGVFVLNGNGISLSGGVTNLSTNLQALNLAIALSTNITFAANAGDIRLQGVVSGTNGLVKSGANRLILAAANTYSGGTTLQGGTLVLHRVGSSTGSTVGGTIAIHGGTLLLGQANQISDSSAIVMDGGSIDTGGFADRVGRLTVNGNAAIRGLVESQGPGVATNSDFLFSGVDLSNYATGGGGALDLGAGYATGATINFASSDFTGWLGYSATSLNQFADKIVFGDTGMKAQIAFNPTSGLTYLTAVPVPEAEVKVAAALLMALVGMVEWRWRRRG